MQHIRQPAPTLFAKLIRYRWLIRELVVRDLKIRYRGSLLGIAWTMLNPLLFMGVYLLVFGVFLQIGVKDYPIYLLSGLLPWTWLANSLTQGTSSILDGRMYVGKTVFPAEILVIVPLLSNFVNFVFSLPILFIAIELYHRTLGWPLLYLPVIVGIQMIITLGLLFLLATFNVFYRDLQQLIAFLVMLFFYLTPIFYQQSSVLKSPVVPEFVKHIMLASPFAVIVGDYQDLLYNNTFPSLSSLVLVAFLAIVLLAAGHSVFEKYKESMGEYL